MFCTRRPRHARLWYVSPFLLFPPAHKFSLQSDADFFWLGYTPCRTVLLVGMVVAIQVYDKRAIYTSKPHLPLSSLLLTTPPVDDGTAVIDCVLRHPHPTPSRPTGGPSAKPNPKRPSPKKQRLDKAKTLESIEPPPPVTEQGYPVRVVGRIVRHYQSKQIHADSISVSPS